VTSVLTGTSSPEHLRDNLQAVEADPLPGDIMSRARALQKRDLVVCSG